MVFLTCFGVYILCRLYPFLKEVMIKRLLRYLLGTLYILGGADFF